MAVLLLWGPAIFETGQAIESSDDTASGRWSDHALFGRAPAGQFLGPDSDEVSIEGTIHSDYDNGGAEAQIVALQAASRAGEVHALVTGDGAVFGQFRAMSISRHRTVFGADGRALKVSFKGSFKAYAGPSSPIVTLWG